MKLSVMNSETIDFPVARETTADTGLIAFAKRTMTSLREARSARRLRNDMAQLDDMILGDLGIGPDEIARIHTGEDFTPRCWQVCCAQI